MSPLAGDVLFVWGRGFIPHLVEDITHGPSHAALFVDETTLCEAQGGRLAGETPLSEYYDDPAQIWRDTTLTDAERTEMVTYAKTLYGSPYDYALIPLEWARFEFGAKLAWYHEHKHRICSTYIYDIAAHVGRKWTEIPNPAPVDLLRGGILTQVYERRGGVWETKRSALPR